jgi:hypothetical protein
MTTTRIPTFLAVALVALPRLSDPVRVPRVPVGTVAIDARHAPGEWDRAVTQQLSDGSTVRLQHDGTHLFIAIVAARSGFPSVCGVLGDRVRVYHASAALGALSYAREGAGWTTRDTAFVYGMRDPDSTEAARQERRAYLTEHGWVSTTVRMGGARAIEMQIALSELESAPRIALGFFIPGSNNQWSILPWPATVPTDDGCIESQLVRGYATPRLTFQPATWAELVLER